MIKNVIIVGSMKNLGLLFISRSVENRGTLQEQIQSLAITHLDDVKIIARDTLEGVVCGVAVRMKLTGVRFRLRLQKYEHSDLAKIFSTDAREVPREKMMG